MASDSASIFAGGGELGRRMRELDWASTPLGPVEHWPQSLRTCVRIILTSQQPMFVWWGPQLINLYNDAYISILGGKHPAALGRPASEVWREIWDSAGPRAAKAMRENEGTFDEALLLIMERNGYREETYYTFSYSPVPGDTGEAGGILCANSSDARRIFGERQQALLREVAARTANARSVEEACAAALAAFASNARDLPFAMLYLLDGGRLVLEATAGIDADAVPPEIDATTETALPAWEAVASRALVTAPVRPGMPSGPWPEPPSECAALPILGADQAPTGVLVIGRNPFRLLDDDYRRFLELVCVQLGNAISNARTAEEERKRAEALAELDRAKTTFFSNISHEFRTPLTLMLGPTEDALAGGGALAGEQLRAVYRNELRLLKLVNALLDFSRLEAGRMQGRFARVALHTLTADLASTFRSAIEAAGLTFTVEAESIEAYVDSRLWETIVLNLISNAFKYTQRGGVTVRLRADGDRALLHVIDTGAGIPAAEMPRLFERFHRIENTARTHEGTGIGLAMVQELVRLHGGTIEVQSTEGKGSEFVVAIPLGHAHLPGDQLADDAAGGARSTARAAFAEEAERWQVPAEPRAARDPDAGRVLVVDDNADMRGYLAGLLSERWTVLVAANGAEALELARAERPHVIVSDIMMPVLDGYGLLRALRADPQTASIPVLLVSARAGEEAKVEGLESGADDYLVKPFAARELIARVRVHFELSRARLRAETEQHRLHRAEERLRSAIAAAGVGTYIYDLDTGQLDHDDAVRRLFDADGELADRVHPADRARWLERLQATIETGLPYDGEYRVITRDNHLRWMRDKASLGIAGGRRVVAGAIVDITESKVAAMRVETARDQAERASRAKDEFLAMLGHELRNPMAPIMTALELLQMRGQGSRELGIMQRQVGHLIQLIDDLLDIARITRGKVELNKQVLDLHDVVARAIEIAAPLIELRGHQLHVEVPRGELHVHADPVRLAQVLSNLLTNAAKYTPPDGEITVGALAEGADVVIRVRDNGTGIDATLLPHVFELFVQGRRSAERAQGGLGIGLALVHNLVRLHGGRVRALSDGIGQGSTFEVRLRRHTSATAGPEPVRAPEALAARARRVLVVDDNVDAAELLTAALQHRGYDVLAVHDGPQALRAVESFIPDVAVLDLGLPVMDGYELLSHLRSQSGLEQCRFIALTGYGQPSDVARTRASGFAGHLVKPVPFDQLFRALTDDAS